MTGGGGVRHWMRAGLAAGAVIGAAACGSWQKVGSSNGELAPTETLTQLFDAQAFYRRLGRLASGDPLPFIGTVALVGAPGDSVAAIVGLSLENRTLSFQKERDAYQARFRADISFTPAAGRPVQGGQDQTVRVATFQETFRADESILFQKAFQLAPGTYTLVVQVRDLTTGNVGRAEQTVVAAAPGTATTSAPILAYQVTGREQLGRPLEVVLNPRGTVAFGGDTLLAYVEGYRFPGPTAVPFEVRTQSDSVVYRDSLRFQGGRPVEGLVVRLRPDSMALGELQLVVGTGMARRSASALVSFSSAWVVTNFDEMTSLLRYFGHDAELAEVEAAAPDDRAAAWREFVRRTDPNPTTPENEELDAYFGRLAIANTRFRNEGVAGWRTDRGMVFIQLGEPDDILDASAMAQGRVIQWTYLQYRLTLIFLDDAGFGRFRLTNQGRADFERVVNRLRRMGS